MIIKLYDLERKLWYFDECEEVSSMPQINVNFNNANEALEYNNARCFLDDLVWKKPQQESPPTFKVNVYSVIKRNGNQMCLIFDPRCEVFLLNDNGKTIDRLY